MISVNIIAGNPTANPAQLRSCAPGKLILSGEHSVVYGADAVAVAVKEYTKVNFSPVSQSNVINTIFTGISSSVIYPINALSKLKHRLDERFELFSQGDVPVQDILNHPNDLVVYSLMSLLHQLPSRKRLQQFAPHSGVLRSDSSIPNGAGMGSSASAIAATLVLYEHILEKPLTPQQRFDRVKFCERLQHGRGSAIDAATVTFGGMIHIHGGEPQRFDDKDNSASLLAATMCGKWFWLNTGTPNASTGECVQKVKHAHGANSTLWDEFNVVTQSLIEQLDKQRSPIDSIKENNQLLQRIGVVPNTAQQLISEIEQCGGAGKISGAGSISGEKAGVILAYLPDGNIDELLAIGEKKFPEYIKSWNPLHIDELGARLMIDEV